MTVAVRERVVQTDDEGYLVDPTDWSAEFTQAAARQEGLELTEEHWAVIDFMRRYYDEHQIAPDARFVIRFLARERGMGNGARAALFALFPYGYVKQACKIAGMRRPRAWSTG